MDKRIQQEHTRTYRTKKGIKKVLVNKGKKEDKDNLKKILLGTAALSALGVGVYLNRNKIFNKVDNLKPRTSPTKPKVNKPRNTSIEYETTTVPVGRQVKYEPIPDPFTTPSVEPKVTIKKASVPRNQTELPKLSPGKYKPETITDPFLDDSIVPKVKTEGIETKVEIPKLKSAYDDVSPDWRNLSDELQTKYVQEDIDYLKQRITNQTKKQEFIQQSRNKEYTKLQETYSKIQSELETLKPELETETLISRRNLILENRNKNELLQRSLELEKKQNRVYRQLATERTKLKSTLQSKVSNLEYPKFTDEILERNIKTNTSRMRKDFQTIDYISTKLPDEDIIEDFIQGDISQYYDLDTGVIQKEVKSRLESNIKEINSKLNIVDNFLGRYDSNSMFKKLDNNLRYLDRKIKQYESTLSSSPDYLEISRLQSEYNNLSEQLGFTKDSTDYLQHILENNPVLANLYKRRLELQTQAFRYRDTVDKVVQDFRDAKSRYASIKKIKIPNKLPDKELDARRLLNQASDTYFARYDEIESNFESLKRIVKKEAEEQKKNKSYLDINLDYIQQKTQSALDTYTPDILKAKNTFEEYLEKVNKSVTVQEIQDKADQFFIGDTEFVNGVQEGILPIYESIFRKVRSNKVLTQDELFTVKKVYDRYNRKQLEGAKKQFNTIILKYDRELDLDRFITSLDNIAKKDSKYPIENNVKILNRMLDNLVKGEFIGDDLGNLTRVQYEEISKSLASKIQEYIYGSNLGKNRLLDVEATLPDTENLLTTIQKLKLGRKVQNEESKELLSILQNLRKRSRIIDTGEDFINIDNLVQNINSSYESISKPRELLRVAQSNPRVLKSRYTPKTELEGKVKDARMETKQELERYLKYQDTYKKINSSNKKFRKGNLGNYKYILGRYGITIKEDAEGYLQVSNLPSKVDTYLDKVELGKLGRDVKIDYDKINSMLRSDNIDLRKLGYNERIYVKRVLGEELGIMNKSLYLQGFNDKNKMLNYFSVL